MDEQNFRGPQCMVGHSSNKAEVMRWSMRKKFLSVTGNESYWSRLNIFFAQMFLRVCHFTIPVKRNKY